MDIDICPPWWPEILWRILHHGPRPPEPPPDPWLEDLLIVVSIHELAGKIRNVDLAGRIQGVTAQALEGVTKTFGQ